MTDRPPNILLIHCHDLGRYLGCYEAPVETPRIDSLAADGARFTRHFVTAPQCSPSRGSLVTGRHPHEHGLMGLAHGRWELHDDQRVLSQYLGDAGYETHLFGLQHLTTNVDRLAYDEIHHPDVRTPQAPPVVHQRAKARRIAPDVAAWLRDRESEEPFFASVGFFELHRVERDDGTFGFGGEEYEHPEATDVEAPAFLPDRPGIRRDVAEMHGMVHAVDDGVGTILDGLAEAGLDAETLVVFTTEHGLAFPRAKGCCYDSGIGAALLCRHPSIVESESVRTELCSNVDVFATLLDLADVEIPADVFGHSLRPLLSGDGDAFERRERIFAGMTWHDRYNPMRAIRTDRYKYVRNFWHLPAVYLTTDIYASASGRAVRTEYLANQREYEELYDLSVDPHERNDVSDAGDYAAVRDRLRGELQEWMRKTDDPLLSGPVLPADYDEIEFPE